MTDPDDVLAQLEALKVEWLRLDAARDQVKEQIVEAAIAAFQQGKEPADIYGATPFSQVWIRAQVRDAGIPKAKPGTKPKPRPKRSAAVVRPEKAVMRSSAMPSTRKPKPKAD